ncbi:RND transporter [Rickettsia felis]|nr:RND transporter [Rickettsia felis]
MRGKAVSFDEAISGVCYYFMRLPRSLRLLAMTF